MPTSSSPSRSGRPTSTPRGSLKFDEKGRATAPFFFIQQVKDGQLVLLEQYKVD